MTPVPKPLLALLGAASEVRRLPAHAMTVGLAVLEGANRVRRDYGRLADQGAAVLGGILGADERVPEPAPAPVSVADVPDPLDRRVGEEPVPGYDGMSLGALRNELRSLSRDEVERALTYERANRSRGPVVTLLENRLAKLAVE